MKLIVFNCFLFLILSFRASAVVSSEAEIAEMKRELIYLASQFTGQGDPDFKIQNQLEPYVERLLKMNPQPPVKERLTLLHGVWKQVWGPYDYRNDERGVDPTLEVTEIYQVVDPDNFYYNVSPNYKNGDRSRERINYLKGQYSLSKSDPNGLDVRFVKFPGMSQRPIGRPIYDFVKEAEDGTLPNMITVVPTPIVRLFFTGGTLREIYTDETLRILYGSNTKEFKKKYLYIMIRQ
jgi:hypothetical protein